MQIYQVNILTNTVSPYTIIVNNPINILNLNYWKRENLIIHVRPPKGVTGKRKAFVSREAQATQQLVLYETRKSLLRCPT